MDLFLVNFELFQSTQRKHFSWRLFLLTSQIVNCRPRLEKKSQIARIFFGIFELLEHIFLSEHFTKFIYGGVFHSIEGYRLYLCICISGGLHSISFFLDIFQFCFGEAVSKHLHDIICDRV